MDSNLTDLITALANVVMAGGVVFAAGQLFISKRQQNTQLEIHIVELHTHFQQQMREVQKVFPPEVNNAGWVPNGRDEERALRLFWYLVFDEWYTCKHLSSERRLNALWERYRYGVISALKKTAFDNEVRKMFGEETSFFGLGEKFALEIDELRGIAAKLQNFEMAGGDKQKLCDSFTAALSKAWESYIKVIDLLLGIAGATALVFVASVKIGDWSSLPHTELIIYVFILSALSIICGVCWRFASQHFMEYETLGSSYAANLYFNAAGIVPVTTAHLPNQPRRSFYRFCYRFLPFPMGISLLSAWVMIFLVFFGGL